MSKNVQNKIDVGSYQHQFIYNIVHIHFCYNCVYLYGYCSFQFDYFNIFFLSPPIASDSLSSPFSLSSLIQFPLFPYSLPPLSSLESSKRIDTNYQILQTHSKSRSQTLQTHINYNQNCERKRRRKWKRRSRSSSNNKKPIHFIYSPFHLNKTHETYVWDMGERERDREREREFDCLNKGGCKINILMWLFLQIVCVK